MIKKGPRILIQDSYLFRGLTGESKIKFYHKLILVTQTQIHSFTNLFPPETLTDKLSCTFGAGIEKWQVDMAGQDRKS